MALDLPEASRAAIVRWRDRAIADRADLRPVRAEALHLTLCFLGWRAEAEAPPIADLAFEASKGLAAPCLSPRAIAAVPPRRPRLFALDLADENGGAVAVQAAVSEALAAQRLYEPESRPFWPHVTLARVRRDARAGPLEADPPPDERFQARDLTLYRSTLRPQGTLYEALARARLGR